MKRYIPSLLVLIAFLMPKDLNDSVPNYSDDFLKSDVDLIYAAIKPFASDVDVSSGRTYSIAQDIASLRITEKPLYSDDTDFIRSYSVLISTIKHESAFKQSVEKGLSSRDFGADGKDWCLMQIRLGKPDSTGKSPLNVTLDDDAFKISKHPGINGRDLLMDRRLCLRVGYRMLAHSIRKCSHYHPDRALSMYLSGKCTKAYRNSRLRLLLASKIQSDMIHKNIDTTVPSML